MKMIFFLMTILAGGKLRKNSSSETLLWSKRNAIVVKTVFARYASSSVFPFSCLLQFSEELKVVKEGDKKPEQPKQETEDKMETVVEETEAKMAKLEEEGEIEEGEEEASSSKSSYEELQELRASLK